jgi:hypothetical protein
VVVKAGHCARLLIRSFAALPLTFVESRFLPGLTPAAEAWRREELGAALADGGDNLRARLVDIHRDGHR